MSGFARRAKGLELTFPLSGQQGHEPGELSEFVQLVHPLFGPLQRIGSSERQGGSVNGAAGVQLLVLTTCPERVVRVVEYAHVSHDDAVARQIRFELAPFNVAAGTVLLQATDFDGAGAAAALGVRYPLHKPVILGPGDVLQARAAIAAGQFIDGVITFVDYSAADLIP